jgi:hypothetical protein
MGNIGVVDIALEASQRVSRRSESQLPVTSPAGRTRMRTVELALILLLIGCRTVSVPAGNLPFAEGAAGAAISGCFAEQGEAQDETRTPFLSTWLWPDVARDAGITVISFVPAADGTIVVEALAVGPDAIRERVIPASAGRDGRVFLEGGFWFSPFWNQSFEPPPIVGPYSEHTELGLDTAGDLKLRRSGWAVGLAFLLIPFAYADDEQYRFRRTPCPDRTPDTGQ